MKNVYIVLGEGGIGKSSLIRSLTGLYNARATKVRLRNKNDIDIAVYIRSEQENTHGKNTPAKVLNDILTAQEPNMLIALRINPINGYPPGIDYINLISQHCNILGIAILDWRSQGMAAIPCNNISHITFAKSYPSNYIASIVRNAWGWM